MTITVIRRNRLGNDTEDITFFPERSSPLPGRGEGSIAIMDGYDVLDIPLPPPIGPGGPGPDEGLEKPPASKEHESTPAGGDVGQTAKKLFNVLNLDIKSGPRGITYIESSAQFAIDDIQQPTKLFLVDQAGRPNGILNIQYPGGYTPTFVEGLGYVPRTSRQFPDHIVIVAIAFPQGQIESRLEVIDRRNGQVVHEVMPAAPLGSQYLTGVCYADRNLLFVSTDDDNKITALDFAGQIVEGAAPPPPRLRSQGFEGLVQTPDHRVAAANSLTGIIALMDARPETLRRLHYEIGVGLSIPSGLAWDTTTNQHLVCSFARFRPLDKKFISAVSPSLDSARQVVTTDQTGRQLAYLPEEKLIALTQRAQTSSILLFNESGQQVEKINLDPQTVGNVFAFTYLPERREFVVSTTRPAQLLVLSRKGVYVRTIDAASAGINRISSVAFNPAHPRSPLLLTDRDSTRAAFVDLEGTKVGEFDVKTELKLLRPNASSGITTGPDAGAFGMVDSDNSELVVFRDRPR